MKNKLLNPVLISFIMIVAVSIVYSTHVNATTGAEACASIGGTVETYADGSAYCAV